MSEVPFTVSLDSAGVEIQHAGDETHEPLRLLVRRDPLDGGAGSAPIYKDRMMQAMHRTKRSTSEQIEHLAEEATKLLFTTQGERE